MKKESLKRSRIANESTSRTKLACAVEGLRHKYYYTVTSQKGLLNSVAV